MYTIYESIGKSVVVPYCGSKTINVRLTVSPDVKTTAGKASAKHNGGSVFQRRYKYKSRKLIPTDEEEVIEPPQSITRPDTEPLVDITDGPTKTVEPTAAAAPAPSAAGSRVCSAIDTPAAATVVLDNRNATANTPCKTLPTTIIRNNCADGSAADNVYECIPSRSSAAANNKRPSAAAVAAMQRLEEAQLEMANYSCRECSSQCPLLDQSVVSAAAAAAPATKPRKLMRKSRSKKQKTQKSSQARVRSLSVGNENCYQMAAAAAASANGAATNVAQLIEGGEEECLNNLRRNDLIDIIRESMEKNRLCFQSNG